MIPGENNGQSLLEEVVLEHFLQFPKISALDVIKLASTCSPLQVVNFFRKLLPDKIASEKEVRVAQMILEGEFNQVLKPQKTPSGYRLDVVKTVSLLRALYPWAPKEEMWKLWGDGREVGNKQSVVIAISNVDNEQKLNGIDFHSPKDVWPIAVFGGDDKRWNLEVNIGASGGQPGWLEREIKALQTGTEL